MTKRIGKAARADDKRKASHPRSIPEPEQPKKAKKVVATKPRQFRSKSGSK